MKLKAVFILVLFLTTLSSISYSQLYEVSGGNFGVSANAGYILNNPKGAGYSFGGGLTTSFGELFFPEVNYSFQKEGYGSDSSGINLSNSSHQLGLALNNKIQVFTLSLGKSNKGECWHLMFKLLLDYRYAWTLANNSNFAFEKQNDSGFNFGLGIRPSYSGGHKSRVAWSYFYDVYYHLDLNKNNQMALQENGWKQNGLFFRMTILHYKTSDFLSNGFDKKKAYKRHY
jgi:hypothetical protein